MLMPLIAPERFEIKGLRRGSTLTAESGGGGVTTTHGVTRGGTVHTGQAVCHCQTVSHESSLKTQLSQGRAAG
jgi:hypothetical protein